MVMNASGSCKTQKIKSKMNITVHIVGNNPTRGDMRNMPPADGAA